MDVAMTGVNLPPSPSSDSAKPLSTNRNEGYWSAKAINARWAEQAGQPLEPACPACGGIQWVKDPNLADNEYPLAKLVRCPICTSDQRREWLLKNCGLEPLMRKVRLSHWMVGVEDSELEKQRVAALATMQTAIADRFGLVSFYGDFGSGKSHALATVCNELRDRMVETLYVPMVKVLDHLRSLYDAKENDSSYWQRLLDVPVLALDEVTRFKATEWARERLFSLADTRYQRRKSHLTLFATNDNPKALRGGEDYGYLASRMCEGTLVELRGDVREAAAQWWENS